MGQGETLEELEENPRDACTFMVMEGVVATHLYENGLEQSEYNIVVASLRLKRPAGDLGYSPGTF